MSNIIDLQLLCVQTPQLWPKKEKKRQVCLKRTQGPLEGDCHPIDRLPLAEVETAVDLRWGFKSSIYFEIPIWLVNWISPIWLVNWISPNTSALNLCPNFFTIHCSVPGEKHRVQRWCIQSEDSSERRAAGCTNMGALLTPGELPGIGRRQLVPMVWLQIVCSCSFSRWHLWRSNVLRFWKGQWKSTE